MTAVWFQDGSWESGVGSWGIDVAGEFLTELRPVVALFLRFGGIDYDTDPDAGSKLDTFIRRVQQIVARYDGTLLQLTIGDKGSYLYAAFGAPTAHEDDARRAALCALEWRALPRRADLSPTAPNWHQPRRDGNRCLWQFHPPRLCRDGCEVNLAARLMGRAVPGEILISGRARAALVARACIDHGRGTLCRRCCTWISIQLFWRIC